MTLHQLNIFLVVAREKSIKAAAERLHTAQPAISRQLQLLSTEVGTKLHRRIGQGIELTPAGRFFVKEANIIVSQIEQLKVTLSSKAAHKESETLNIGGTYAASASLLPKILARFAKSHPRVNLHLRTHERITLERMVLNGEVDIALVHHLPAHRQLTSEPYGDEPLIAFVAPNHPLARKGRVEWHQLGEVRFVTRKPIHDIGSGARYLQSLKEHGHDPSVLMYCDSPEAVKEAVARNQGVGILFKSVVENNLKKREFKPIKLPRNGESFAGKTFIVYHKMRPLSSCARDFLELLRKHRPKTRSPKHPLTTGPRAIT